MIVFLIIFELPGNSCTSIAFRDAIGPCNPYLAGNDLRTARTKIDAKKIKSVPKSRIPPLG